MGRSRHRSDPNPPIVAPGDDAPTPIVFAESLTITEDLRCGRCNGVIVSRARYFQCMSCSRTREKDSRDVSATENNAGRRADYQLRPRSVESMGPRT